MYACGGGGYESVEAGILQTNHHGFRSFETRDFSREKFILFSTSIDLPFLKCQKGYNAEFSLGVVPFFYALISLAENVRSTLLAASSVSLTFR